MKIAVSVWVDFLGARIRLPVRGLVRLTGEQVASEIAVAGCKPGDGLRNCQPGRSGGT
jgi:hypothetical protein